LNSGAGSLYELQIDAWLGEEAGEIEDSWRLK
jgi:hypothetical protein